VGESFVPTWGEILSELSGLRQQGMKLPYDTVRRKYLGQLYAHTGREVILYASKWTQALGLPQEVLSITEEDLEGLMEVVHGLKGPGLDLIIHSPGGSAEATEALVSYLRSKFKDIRAIIPHAAMSAATMWACAADRIVMGKHSFLGPIDPQIVFARDGNQQLVAAPAIIDQFDLAQKQCEDPKLFPSWIPILPQYGPALLFQCRNALELSRELVAKWLESFMFKGDSAKARTVAQRLADHTQFKSHGRHIDRETAKSLGLVVENLEEDQILQDLVLSVYHATTHTFNGTSAVKIIENHRSRAFVKQVSVTQVVLGQRDRQPADLTPSGPDTPPPPANE